MTRLALLVAWIGWSGCVITAEGDPVCGDGQREGTEECDDGNLLDGDGCTRTCTFEPYCGDAAVDSGEECDDGNNAGGDGCSAGCVIEPFCGDGAVDPGEDCDDSAHVPSDGCSPECKTERRFATTADWSFHTVAAPTVDLLCPVGFDTVAVYSQAVSDADAPIGAGVIDLFDCSVGFGTISSVYEGRYRTYIAVTNAAGTLTYATSLSKIVDLRTGNMDFSTTIVTDGGYFKVSWDLVGAMTNMPLDCSTVATSGISVLSTEVATPTNFVEDIFTCMDDGGISSPIEAGTYTVSISALDGTMQPLGIAPALTNKVIQAPNKVTDLGVVVIPIDGL